MEIRNAKIEKVYAVTWTEKAREEYGIPKNKVVVLLEPKDEIEVNISKSKMGRPKLRYADSLSIFYEKDEAEAFRKGNSDWITIEIQLNLNENTK